jgi:hypothetical protein
MTTINIDADTNHVILYVASLNPQQFSYTVEVTDENGTVSFSDNGHTSGKQNFDLGPGASLIDMYLTIYWSVIDPTGPANQFSAIATAKQNNITRPVLQKFSGTTTAGVVNDTTYAHFV